MKTTKQSPVALDTILIVDDSSDNLIVMKKVLEKALPKVTVLTCQHPEKAQSLLQETEVALAVLDVQMPGIDGLELCKRIKTHAETPLVSVMLITSHDSDPKMKAKGLALGADDFITRPMDNAELCARVKVALRVHRAESALRLIADQAEAEAAQLGYVLEDSLNEIFVLDAETFRFLNVNRGGRENLGYSMEELRGMTPLDIKPEMTPKSFTELVKPLREGAKEKIQFETIHRRKDGTDYPVEVHLQLMANDHPVFVAIIIDITERKRAEAEKEKLEEQLRQAQKMESIGRLAGGVAHDFNNMLQVILGYTDMALNETDPKAALYNDLIESRKAASRAANLTRQLLAFASKQTMTPKVLDLNETVSGMLMMLQRLIGEDIELTWQPTAADTTVKMDPSQIDQVLANLCVNARDAIAGVGKLKVETGTLIADANFCAMHTELVPGEYVTISVSDTGCGMDSEMIKHIFEPFYTTKGVGEGTGLGLATVYGIIKQNNGSINLTSVPEKGTTFRLCLPRHLGEAVQRPASGPAQAALRGHDTVLLVEDELSILKMGKRMLESLGYRVLTAGLPDEAIVMAEKHAGEIHLLLTDVVMPQMNGLDLAIRLALLHPEIKYMFMSGYTADIITKQGLVEEGMHFIQKPFTIQDLATKVRDVLKG